MQRGIESKAPRAEGLDVEEVIALLRAAQPSMDIPPVQWWLRRDELLARLSRPSEPRTLADRIMQRLESGRRLDMSEAVYFMDEDVEAAVRAEAASENPPQKGCGCWFPIVLLILVLVGRVLLG